MNYHKSSKSDKAVLLQLIKCDFFEQQCFALKFLSTAWALRKNETIFLYKKFFFKFMLPSPSISCSLTCFSSSCIHQIHLKWLSRCSSLRSGRPGWCGNHSEKLFFFRKIIKLEDEAIFWWKVLQSWKHET